MTMTNGSIQALSDLDAAFGWKAPGSEPDLRDLLQELQGFRVSMVKGAAASTLTKVLNAGGVSTGAADAITSSDVILAAVEFDNVAASGVAKLSLRNDVRVATTTGYVHFSGGATTGGHVLLFWYDKTGFIAQ